MTISPLLIKQFTLDFCCDPSEVTGRKNSFHFFEPLAGRRMFFTDLDCELKIALIGGKMLFCGREDIIRKCKELYEDDGSDWFLEAPNIIKLDEMLSGFGCRIDMIHPFYVSDAPSEPDPGRFEIRLLTPEEILSFRGDDRYSEAFAFSPTAPDRAAAAATVNGEIAGIAGASADGAYMWQIGINVNENARGAGLGETLVSLVRNEVVKEGKLPFYGTAFSHIASQRVALGAGFRPAWVEITAKKK